MNSSLLAAPKLRDIPAIAVKEDWSVVYGEKGSHDWLVDMAVDSEGNIYEAIIVSSSLTNIVKYNSRGELLWQKPYDSTEDVWYWPTDLFIDKEGNIYLTGSLEFDSSTTAITTTSYTKDGRLRWTKYVSDGHARAMAEDSLGNIYICGWTGQFSSDDDALIVGYNQQGELLDYVIEPKPEQTTAHSLAIDKDDNIYIVTSGYYTGDYYDIVTIKYDHSLQKIWEARYYSNENAKDYGHKIVAAEDGSIYVLGVSNNSHELVLLKYRQNGDQVEEVWRNRFGDGLVDHWYDSEYEMRLVLDKAGDIYVAASGDDLSQTSKWNIYLLKYDQVSGDIIWQDQFNDLDIDDQQGPSLVIDAENNIFLAGYSGEEGHEHFLIKYDTNGNRQWIQTHASLGGGFSSASYGTKLALDPQGGIIAAFGSSQIDNFDDVLTIKYVQPSKKQLPSLPFHVPVISK